MTLGKKVKQARLEKKLTQKELAGDFITRNMLSQIENDLATPSIRTMEYLAKKLDKSVGYFIGEMKKEDELGQIVTKLLNLYEIGEYTKVIELIQELIEFNPAIFSKEIIINIYINCYMKAGFIYKTKNEFKNAKKCFEKILEFEKDLAITGDIMLYKAYSQLAEVNSYINEVEESRKYNAKAKNMINKMIASRDIQSIYLKLMEGEYEEVINMAKEVEPEKLDMYNRARFNMTLGSAYYNVHEYEDAIVYLEKALNYFKHQTLNRLTAIIYEELSKCYSQLEEYEKSYEYILLAQKTAKIY